MIRFDGLYTSRRYSGEPDDDSMSRHYLRFYEDGTVLTCWTEIDCFNDTKLTAKWFNKGHEGLGQGQYTLSGNIISFSVNNKEGIIDYAGEIFQERLLLNYHSFINGHDQTLRYSFVCIELS